MIRTIEKKLSSTSYRTEFPYDQPVSIDRIMIQNIVLLKLNRIIYKIIVYGVVTNLYMRIIR